MGGAAMICPKCGFSMAVEGSVCRCWICGAVKFIELVPAAMAPCRGGCGELAPIGKLGPKYCPACRSSIALRRERTRQREVSLCA